MFNTETNGAFDRLGILVGDETLFLVHVSSGGMSSSSGIPASTEAYQRYTSHRIGYGVPIFSSTTGTVVTMATSDVYGANMGRHISFMDGP